MLHYGALGYPTGARLEPPVKRRSICTVLAVLALTRMTAAVAGGGVVLSEDTCKIRIGFYEAHFTAYQPQASGDRQFCEDLPETGETIFVLDYLHRSLSEVPVDFRIIRNVTDKGSFARLEDVQALPDLDAVTVFYQPPLVKSNATFSVTAVFQEKGDYVGIVTAGHPTKDTIYTAVFPFSVGARRLPWGIVGFALALLLAGLYVVRTLGAGRREAVA
ncbi:MAG: hypothetical protein OEW35_14480 [Gammaproteobacteria bacterium]|nr:hypothetical protein [Gammaproteobacteria bacterium]MDH5310597.1 hypothetical protein [Gammaproteobacteria bacterium]